MKTVSLISYFN